MDKYNLMKRWFIIFTFIWIGGKILFHTFLMRNYEALNYYIITDIAGVLAIVLGIILFLKKRRIRNP